MNITPHLAVILLITVAFVYFLHYRKPKKEEVKEPSTGDIVLTEYSWIMERIENATTKSELAFIESLADEFEQVHRPHAWVDEMYKDMLFKIQEMYNILSVRAIQQKVK